MWSIKYEYEGSNDVDDEGDEGEDAEVANAVLLLFYSLPPII